MFNVRDFSRKDITKNKENYEFEIALAGNPNVGKSTVFNALTGLKQHTGNWTGKTVENAVGYYKNNSKSIKVVDLPGIYSLYPQTDEEIVANEYLQRKKAFCVIAVVDATNLERNLSLVLQILNIVDKVIVCLNLCDEAKKKGIKIDADELSLQLGVPVIQTSATKNVGINNLMDTVIKLKEGNIKTYKVHSISDTYSCDYEKYISNLYIKSKEICDKCVYTPYNSIDKTTKIDRIMTSKIFAIPIMLLLLSIIFWITIVGANYISDALSLLFDFLKNQLCILLNHFNTNAIISDFLINGIYTTLSWVVAVMLPPMAIFFPIFSLLEDSGFLPRIAFNLDSAFCRVGGHGKQALTMAMGFGCNACGVMGCRIIDCEKEKNIAILTNSFIPCNGRLPTLIAISSIFIANSALIFIDSIITTIVLMLLIILSVVVTFLTSKLLSTIIFKEQNSTFALELPPYRKPRIFKTIIYSIKDRAWFVLLRAVSVAIPCGAVIWLMANITIDNITLLEHCTAFFDPFGKLLGLDGVIIMAFILGLPANEIVIPIILMSYTKDTMLTDYTSLEHLSTLLTANGWNLITAICFLILCIFHFPCSTSMLTIYKETKSIKLSALAFVIPTIIGILLCFLINLVSLMFV